jgi:HK97 family phage major capsid protein
LPTDPVIESSGIGAAFTPEQWAQYVLDHLAGASVVLASGATEVRTSAKAIHVPRITGDGTVAWYDELEPIAPGGPDGDELVLTPKKVATLARLSDEAVADSNPSIIDGIGNAMTRAVAREADRAIIAGTGTKQPTGLLNLTPALPSTASPVSYASIVTAAGMIGAAGGQADTLYINPTDLTALQLVTDANDRPLIQPDMTQGASGTIAGLTVWPTAAVPAGTAIVAQADQIVVAVREDASVAVSEHALFEQDGTVCRVIARLDSGVADSDGLVVIKTGGMAARSKAKGE